MSAVEEYRKYRRHCQCSHSYGTMTGLAGHADAAIAELEEQAHAPRKCPFCGEVLLHSSTIRAIEEYVKRAEKAESALEEAREQLRTAYLRRGWPGRVETFPRWLASIARHDAEVKP